LTFKEISSRYDGPALEQEVLAFWREHGTFEQTLAMSEGRPRFSFNEGPPTANGKPGIHHVLARAFKDIFPRYKTMRGYYVPRKAGWDTHGLPVEHEVEKLLKKEGRIESYDKDEIEEKVGISEFTRLCRESVMTYIGDWEKMTERMGFWVHLDEAYYTLDNSYIESVWNLLKIIFDKGLIYRGYKVVPYDPRIGATLSSHELALGYKETDDPSITVRFKVSGEEDTYILVWTTTPWTLPSNLALAVGEDIDYSYCESEGQTLIVAEALREAVFRDIEHAVTKTVKGSDLVGTRYEQLFDYLQVDAPDAFQVLPADFVSTEDGTGIVHTAPAYGVDDLAFGQEHGLPVVHGVGLDGNFIDDVEPVAGMFFKDADKPLIRILRERGMMFRSERYTHNYPFGWRTGDPIIYYAKNAWYIRTPRWPFRQLAGEQRGLGALPGTFLGHAIADLDGRRGQLRDRRFGRRTRAVVRAVAGGTRSAPARSGRDHLRERRQDLAAGTRGDRLLVRFGCHVLRAVALPVREPGDLRATFPGGFHLRGDRPDSRLVLHAARDRDARFG
jgi:isoleucyl-tRNA synthetase